MLNQRVIMSTSRQSSISINQLTVGTAYIGYILRVVFSKESSRVDCRFVPAKVCTV